MALRPTILPPLCEMIALMREFLNPHVRHLEVDRCVRRHRVSNLQALKPKAPKPPHKPSKLHEPGHLHVDMKHLR